MSNLDHSVMKQESDTEKAPIDLGVASDTKNPPSIDFSSILNGLTGFFFAELGKFIIGMKDANDKRNVAYKDLDAFLKILVEHSWFTSVNLSWHDYEYLSFSYLEAPSDGLLVTGFLNERFSKCYSE